MRVVRYALGAVVALGAVAALILAWATVGAWIQREGGFRAGDGNSPSYLFLSALGSIILPPLLTLAGLAALWAWHNQCEVHGCHWPTRRKTAAGARACWKHHPEPHMTVEQLKVNHHLYLGRRPGPG